MSTIATPSLGTFNVQGRAYELAHPTPCEPYFITKPGQVFLVDGPTLQQMIPFDSYSRAETLRQHLNAAFKAGARWADNTPRCC